MAVTSNFPSISLSNQSYESFNRHYQRMEIFTSTKTIVLKLIHICLYTLLVCLSACLYPINVKTAEPIGPKFCVGLCMPPGKVYEKICLQLNQIFTKLKESTTFFIKSANFWGGFVLQCTYTNRNYSQLKQKIDAKRR